MMPHSKISARIIKKLNPRIEVGAVIDAHDVANRGIIIDITEDAIEDVIMVYWISDHLSDIVMTYNRGIFYSYCKHLGGGPWHLTNFD